MEKNFKFLSLKEEKELTSEELKEYYKDFRREVLKRKLTNTTKGATTIAPKLRNITSKIAVTVTHAFTSKEVEWICDGKENILDVPAIFAYTHQGILDTFVWIPKVKQHCIILHGCEVNKLLLLCQTNTGLVLVKKGDKYNNNNAKLDMIKLLLDGHSIAYFPEGTWNLSSNKLFLPLSYGFLDIAKKAMVPVVPAVHEFTYDYIDGKQKIVKIHTRFGKPIYVNNEDDLLEKLEEYKEAIATMRYELIEEKGIFSRKDISNQEYINFLQDSFKNLKFGKLNWPKEKKYIFNGMDEFYLFHHINEIEYNENGEFLETKEVERLKKLNKKHGIEK